MENKNVLKVILVIMATVIGAGFASGKEIYNFFVIYGLNGIIGIILSGTLTGIIIYTSIKIILNNKIYTNKDFLNCIHGNDVLYYIINIFLLMSFYIMIAGFTSYFKQEYAIATYITSPIFCLILYFILINKIDGIVKINSIIAPILILIMMYINIKYFKINITKPIIYRNNLIMCVFKAILYSSYNSIILIPIIITLKKYIKNNKVNMVISFLSAIFIIALALGVYGILICNTGAKYSELPVISVITNKVEKNIYAIAIEIAILTSAVSAGYGFLENFNSIMEKNKSINKKIVGIICIIGIPVSSIGFGNLINVLYPTFGLLGLFQILLIFRKFEIINNKI